MKMGEARRPRGRPRSFDKRQALGAIRETFWTKGFAGTSLDDLAAAAGVARPSLYAAFGDKRSMYLSAIAQLEAELQEALTNCLAPERPLHEGLLAFFEASIDLYAGGAEPRGCLAICTASAEATGDAAIRDALARMIAMVDAAFEARFASSRGSDHRSSAILASSVLHSLAIRARAGQSRAALLQLAHASVDLIASDPGPAVSPNN